jgi:hypothetical protein
MENKDNANPPPQHHPHLKIPAFWSSNPEAWFLMVEGQFVLKGVTQDTLKFYHVLGSLPETAVRGLGDLMRGPPPEDAYTQLRTRLLAAHTLTEFQRMEKLLAAQAFGGQKPSDMLHDLVQFCPDGEEQTRIFRYLFLQRLPTEIRIILAEDRDSTLAALAARADQLWAHSTRQPPSTRSGMRRVTRQLQPSLTPTPEAADKAGGAAARAAHSAVEVAVAPLPR